MQVQIKAECASLVNKVVNSVLMQIIVQFARMVFINYKIHVLLVELKIA